MSLKKHLPLKRTESEQLLRNWCAKCAPFLERDMNGKLIIYKNPTDAYLSIIKHIYFYAPCGFIDVPLFLIKLQQIPIALAEYICFKKNQIVILKKWHYECNELVEQIKEIMIALLEYSNTGWNEQAFQAALDEYFKTI